MKVLLSLQVCEVDLLSVSSSSEQRANVRHIRFANSLRRLIYLFELKVDE